MRDHIMEEEIYTFAENDGPLHSSINDLSIQRDSLESNSWFHGIISRVDAEKRIRSNGVFLVRESATKDGGFVVSTKWNGKHLHVLIKTIHNKVTRQINYKFELEHSFPTVTDLIKFYVDNQLPFAARSEAALYKPAPVPTLDSSGQRGRSMFESPAESLVRDKSWERMHRFGSEVVLNDNEREKRSTTSRFSDLRSFNKAALKVQSLFDLDKRTNEEIEEGEEPRSSGFSTVRRNTEASVTLKDSPLLSNNNFSSANKLNGSPNAKRQPNISKGRYLEMVDKVQVPIKNLEIWDGLSPPTPTNSDVDHAGVLSSAASNFPCYPDNSHDEDATYMDMSSSGSEPTKPPHHLFDSDEPEIDVYGLLVTPTPTTRQPPFSDRISNWDVSFTQAHFDEIAVWQKRIEAASINWKLTSHVQRLRHDVYGIKKPLDPIVWQRIRMSLVGEQPLIVAEQLVLENARFLLLKHWDENSEYVPGVKHGFHLVLLPDAKGFRDDIQERYFVLSRFIIASLVTEMNSSNRLKLLRFWLQVGDALLTIYRDYFCLHALLNAIFSNQVSHLTDTISTLLQLPEMNSLFRELATVHQQGSVARTSLATCVPDVGRFAQLYSAELNSSTTDQPEEGEAQYCPVGLSHLLADLDTQMLALLSARGWQTFQGRLWIEDITAGKQDKALWSELFHVETLMSLLWGPNDLDPANRDELHSKLDRALTMFAERTQLLESR